MMSGRGADRQLLIQPDDLELIGDGIDATRIVLRVADEYGAVRPFANAAIALAVEGPARSLVKIRFRYLEEWALSGSGPEKPPASFA